MITSTSMLYENIIRGLAYTNKIPPLISTSAKQELAQTKYKKKKIGLTCALQFALRKKLPFS